ncbi:MAG: hypothetical protein QXP36_06305 [Conexivisphaerales archaeon]
MHVDIDYKTDAVIGKHNCSKCGGEFKLKEGLMISIIKNIDKTTFFLCKACLEKGVPYQSKEFDIKKDRYPKIGLR